MGIEYDVELLRSQLEHAAETAERIIAAPNPDYSPEIVPVQYWDWAMHVKWRLEFSLEDAKELRR